MTNKAQAGKPRVRKSSAVITLTLVGSAALHGCGDGSSKARDIYASKADCVREWNDESRCEPMRSSAGYYRGPYYTPSGSPREGTQSPARAGSKAISSSVSRGGFGSLSAFHSSGS
jgi:uncharacterized protein YgiB involved in biofilm formation